MLTISNLVYLRYTSDSVALNEIVKAFIESEHLCEKSVKNHRETDSFSLIYLEKIK